MERDTSLREVLSIAPSDLIFIRDECFGELCTVNGEVGLEAKDRDLPFEALFTETLDCADCAGATVAAVSGLSNEKGRK